MSSFSVLSFADDQRLLAGIVHSGEHIESIGKLHHLENIPFQTIRLVFSLISEKSKFILWRVVLGVEHPVLRSMTEIIGACSGGFNLWCGRNRLKHKVKRRHGIDQS